jgi:hypothetical protein
VKKDSGRWVNTDSIMRLYTISRAEL